MADQEDFLGLNTDEENSDRRGPAFFAPTKAGPRELELLERIHRMDGSFGHTRIIEQKFKDHVTKHYENRRVQFVDVDDDGAERWAQMAVIGGRKGETESQGRYWARVMGWPAAAREPNFDEVDQFCQHHRAKIAAKYQDELREAVAADVAEGFRR